MTKELEEAIKNVDKNAIIEELFRGYSFAIPAIGSCHPYNEIKAGKTSPALEHMKKNRPECYKFIADLVAKDKDAESIPIHKVHLHHIKVGDKYVVKHEYHHQPSNTTFSEGNVFEVKEMDLDTHSITFNIEHLEVTRVIMTFAKFCELTEKETLVKQEA